MCAVPDESVEIHVMHLVLLLISCWLPPTRCTQFLDCCLDYTDSCVNNVQPTICPTCLTEAELQSTYECYGICGAQAPSGCWCDDLCEGFGDW